MTVTAEIDKAGRLVVPKKLRDAHHLVPGTRVTLDDETGVILLQPEARSSRLFRKNGMLVFDTGRPVPPEALNWVKEDREERTEKVGGWKKS